MRGVRRRVLAGAAWEHIRSTDTTHTLCQDHSCGGTRPPTEGTIGKHRVGDSGSLCSMRTPRDCSPRRSTRRRSSRRFSWHYAGAALASRSVWRAARPRSTASFGCRTRCYRLCQTAGAPRGLLALCDASWPARGRRDRGLARPPVWSKNSCGFARVVFQEPPEPFTTLNRACTLCVLADRRKEQHVALALMIPLVMIMRPHTASAHGGATLPQTGSTATDTPP